MPIMKEIQRQINEVKKRTARIQDYATKMDAMAAHSIDPYQAEFLSVHLEFALEKLLTVQTMASFMSRPVIESSRLWRNGSGQYETTKGYCFRAGSPIEVLVPSKFHLGTFYWERTYLRYDGKDYYLEGYDDLPLAGLEVRVREGDQP